MNDFKILKSKLKGEELEGSRRPGKKVMQQRRRPSFTVIQFTDNDGGTSPTSIHLQAQVIPRSRRRRPIQEIKERGESEDIQEEESQEIEGYDGL